MYVSIIMHMYRRSHGLEECHSCKYFGGKACEACGTGKAQAAQADAQRRSLHYAHAYAAHYSEYYAKTFHPEVALDEKT